MVNITQKSYESRQLDQHAKNIHPILVLTPSSGAPAFREAAHRKLVQKEPIRIVFVKPIDAHTDSKKVKDESILPETVTAKDKRRMFLISIIFVKLLIGSMYDSIVEFVRIL